MPRIDHFAAALFMAIMISPAPLYAKCAKDRGDVYETVAKYLNNGFINSGGTHADVKIREVVESALASVVSQRSSASFSQDLNLRNAEYFLQGFNANTTDDLSTEMTVKFLGPAYDGMKYYAHSLRDKGIPWVEQLMRNDPGVPTSPPGGWEWAEEGMRASARLKGDAVVQKSSSKKQDWGLPCENGAETNIEINTPMPELQPGPTSPHGNPYPGIPIIEVDSFSGEGSGLTPRIYYRNCSTEFCETPD